MSEAHGLPLVLVYQDSGFIFQLKKSEVEGELPVLFINVTEKKGRVAFSTLDLVRLSSAIRVIPILVLINISRPKEKAKCEDERRLG